MTTRAWQFCDSSKSFWTAGNGVEMNSKILELLMRPNIPLPKFRESKKYRRIDFQNMGSPVEKKYFASKILEVQEIL